MKELARTKKSQIEHEHVEVRGSKERGIGGRYLGDRVEEVVD